MCIGWQLVTSRGLLSLLASAPNHKQQYSVDRGPSRWALWRWAAGDTPSCQTRRSCELLTCRDPMFCIGYENACNCTRFRIANIATMLLNVAATIATLLPDSGGFSASRSSSLPDGASSGIHCKLEETHMGPGRRPACTGFPLARFGATA